MCRLLGLVLVVVLVGGCGAGSGGGVPNVVVVGEGSVVGDVVPPAQLDVVLGLWGSPADRCADMGGTLVGVVCRDVDY